MILNERHERVGYGAPSLVTYGMSPGKIPLNWAEGCKLAKYLGVINQDLGDDVQRLNEAISLINLRGGL